MRPRTPHVRVSICLAVLLSMACSGGDAGVVAPTDPGPPSFVRLESEVGDFIGGGTMYSYTQADTILTVSLHRGSLLVRITGDEVWDGIFQGPASLSRLEPGHYPDLQRHAFRDPAKGGLSWTGERRGCNTLMGSFTVDRVTYESDVLASIDLSFEQHCDGAAAALRGTIHWRADDMTAPPGPVSPPPSGLWQPSAGSTPSAGNYVYLESDLRDFIGQGRTYTYVGVDMLVSAPAGRVSVAIVGSERWNSDFQAMNVLSRLEPGYYPDLQRYPFHNPAKGGLTWFGEGRGCNRVKGWFIVDRVSYEDGALTALDLRFEQRCEAGTAALHGIIHWDA